MAGHFAKFGQAAASVFGRRPSTCFKHGHEAHKATTWSLGVLYLKKYAHHVYKLCIARIDICKATCTWRSFDRATSKLQRACWRPLERVSFALVSLALFLHFVQIPMVLVSGSGLILVRAVSPSAK